MGKALQEGTALLGACTPAHAWHARKNLASCLIYNVGIASRVRAGCGNGCGLCHLGGPRRSMALLCGTLLALSTVRARAPVLTCMSSYRFSCDLDFSLGPS